MASGYSQLPAYQFVSKSVKKVAPRGCETTPNMHTKRNFSVFFMKSLFWILINNCAKRIFFIP